MIGPWKKKRKPETAAAALPKCPKEDPSSLGNVLIDLGVVTRDELDSVLARQKALGEGLLGVLVCEHGLCTTRDVARAMEIQAQMREGRAAEATLGFQSAATEEMSTVSKQLSDTIRGARIKARARGEKTGLFLLKPAS